MSTSFQQFLRRASTYLNISNNRSKQQFLNDGEIVFSKNNVCVHSIDKQNNELKHVYGYLTVNYHYNDINECTDEQNSTLCLQWTSNESLAKDSKLIEQNFSDNDYELYLNADEDHNRHSFESDLKQCLRPLNDLSNNDKIDIQIESFDNIINTTECDEDCADTEISLNINNNNKRLTDSSHGSDNCLKQIANNSKCDISINTSTISSPLKVMRRCQSCKTTPIKINVSKKYSISSFKVDLKQIKSLRLFFSLNQVNDSSNTDCTNGQLVIVSREGYYKVFHFHTGGLDKLLSVLNEWDFFDKTDSSNETNYLQFSVCRPQLKTEECHPEEKLYDPINEIQWKSCINELGQVVDEPNLRKTIFFAGIEPCLRREIWPFLLHRYEFSSTLDQRKSDDLSKKQDYYEISKKLDEMATEEKNLFRRNIQSIVEKDVVRTDRSNPFFVQNNENINKMKRILINFALYCPSMGYTQGMSDLLAPLLIELESEWQTFWSFLGMMRFTHFVCSPNDTDMDHNLALLRELLRVMLPIFYAHVRQFSDDLELLFAHRWILLCFKREFNESEALQIWESCWTRYQTNYFHLFICLAIISVYGEDVTSHQMGSDEILFHFSTLSMHMNGNLILRKARGLFYQFCVLPKIPCTLKNLTNLSGLEMWDNNEEQPIDCVKRLPNIGHLCQCNTKPNDIINQ